jgi:hypothetical protein
MVPGISHPEWLSSDPSDFLREAVSITDGIIAESAAFKVGLALD